MYFPDREPGGAWTPSLSFSHPTVDAIHSAMLTALSNKPQKGT